MKTECRIVRSSTHYYVQLKLDGTWIIIGRYFLLAFARKVKAAIEKGWDHES